MKIQGLSYFGAALVTRYLLAKSKAGKTGSESYVYKMNRDGFHTRVQHVCNCINSSAGDPSLSAKAIQKAFFTDMSVGELAVSISEVMTCLAEGNTDILAMMYEPGEFGSFIFDQKDSEGSGNGVPAIAESLGLGKDDLEDSEDEPEEPVDMEDSEEEDDNGECGPLIDHDYDYEYNPYYDPEPIFDMYAEE